MNFRISSYLSDHYYSFSLYFQKLFICLIKLLDGNYTLGLIKKLKARFSIEIEKGNLDIIVPGM